MLCHPSAFSSPLILKGYQPLIDLVRDRGHAVFDFRAVSTRLGQLQLDGILGRSPEICGVFFLRALRFFVHLNTAWFHGLHWMDWYPFQWLFRSWSWISGGSLWFFFWWRGVGNSHWSKSRVPIPPAGPSPVHMLRGNLTLIHTVNITEVAFYDTLGIRRTYSRLQHPGVLD